MQKFWDYSTDLFEHEGLLDDHFSGWYGLRRFGHDLVAFIQPKVLVELGTHKGTSFLSFCSAVKKNNLETKLFAIDTWKGDTQTGFYSKQILKDLRKIINKKYSKLNIELIESTFDEVVSTFKNNSIDLLHIDGLHTYKAVKHDFGTWYPKVSKRGIVLFHDIHCTKEGFGVHRFWKKLKKDHLTLELTHSNGLGILFNDKRVYKQLKSYQESWQAYYETKAQLDYYQAFPKKSNSELAQNYKEKLSNLNKKIDEENKQLKKQNKKLRKQLTEINNSKVQKIAQLYYKLRNKLF